MEEAAVQPDVGHHEEHDSHYQRETDPPDQAREARVPVTQEGAHSQLEQKQDQTDGGQPEAVGEARRNVARTKRRPGVPQREEGEEQSGPVMGPEGRDGDCAGELPAWRWPRMMTPFR